MLVFFIVTSNYCQVSDLPHCNNLAFQLTSMLLLKCNYSNTYTNTYLLIQFISFTHTYTAQENEYKYEIERTNRELQEMKRKYYQLRRRDESEDEDEDIQTGKRVR